ncbi:hypothetical protein [uncultured Muribaculum sp.]|uniref:hypothetical protein n=2 Tax=uncultured Muribaculum sp. TaxID=1918613 RepID=UPI002670B248|nr:hypothetical protein [uncultured Muribaculum sp.]
MRKNIIDRLQLVSVLLLTLTSCNSIDCEFDNSEKLFSRAANDYLTVEEANLIGVEYIGEWCGEYEFLMQPEEAEELNISHIDYEQMHIDVKNAVNLLNNVNSETTDSIYFASNVNSNELIFPFTKGIFENGLKKHKITVYVPEYGKSVVLNLETISLLTTFKIYIPDYISIISGDALCLGCLTSFAGNECQIIIPAKYCDKEYIDILVEKSTTLRGRWYSSQLY